MEEVVTTYFIGRAVSACCAAVLQCLCFSRRRKYAVILRVRREMRKPEGG